MYDFKYFNCNKENKKKRCTNEKCLQMFRQEAILNKRDSTLSRNQGLLLFNQS